MVPTRPSTLSGELAGSLPPASAFPGEAPGRPSLQTGFVQLLCDELLPSTIREKTQRKRLASGLLTCAKVLLKSCDAAEAQASPPPKHTAQMTPKHREQKHGTETGDIHQNRKRAASKDTVEKAEDSLPNGRNNLQIRGSDKEPVPGIHKKLQPHNAQKIAKKRAEDLSRHSANKTHRWPTSTGRDAQHH